MHVPTSYVQPAHRPAPALLSVVIPCFNEEAVLAETHVQLCAALDGAPALHVELVYVDDGSDDATLALLRQIQSSDSRVRVIVLSRNFGQQIATFAGLRATSGDAVAVIDADLQDPPSVIIEMLARWREGADIAYGVRTERAGETSFKRWAAKAFSRLIAKISDVATPLDAGDFRIMDRRVVDALLSMPERDLFLRGMVAWTGFRQEAVPFRRAARHAGQTKYTQRKLLRLAMDGVLSFSLLPLRIATWLGALTVGMAVLGIGYALALRLFAGVWINGWMALIVCVLFVGGVQMMLIGVLGAYLGRIYGEAKRRPLYFVKERLGVPPTDA